MFDQAVFGVLTQRFELPVAGSEWRIRRDDHRTGDQPIDDIERFILIEMTDCRDRVDQRATGEHRHQIEQRTFVVVEQ